MLPNKHSSREDIICAERIRQARWAFNLAIGFVAISAGVTLFGCILFLFGQTSRAAYVTVGGVTSTAVGFRCMQFYRDANDRLDKLSRQPENQSDQPVDDIECVEPRAAEDSQNELPEDTAGDALTKALEKLEQAILEGN